jgi:hypothetical protein
MAENLLRYIRAVRPAPDGATLEECYSYCGRINRAYGKSFYDSSLAISRERRRSINALYGFLMNKLKKLFTIFLYIIL